MILMPLTPADAPGMSAIHTSFDLPWERPWSPDEYIKMLSLPSVRGLGAKREGTLCGFILFQVALDTADILFMGVRKDFQKQGIATELLKSIESKALEFIYLEVCVENYKAIAFYSKNNYIKGPLRKKYYHQDNASFDALMMTKKI